MRCSIFTFNIPGCRSFSAVRIYFELASSIEPPHHRPVDIVLLQLGAPPPASSCMPNCHRIGVCLHGENAVKPLSAERRREPPSSDSWNASPIMNSFNFSRALFEHLRPNFGYFDYSGAEVGIAVGLPPPLAVGRGTTS